MPGPLGSFANVAEILVVDRLASTIHQRLSERYDTKLWLVIVPGGNNPYIIRGRNTQFHIAIKQDQHALAKSFPLDQKGVLSLPNYKVPKEDTCMPWWKTGITLGLLDPPSSINKFVQILRENHPQYAFVVIKEVPPVLGHRPTRPFGCPLRTEARVMMSNLKIAMFCNASRSTYLFSESEAVFYIYYLDED